MSSLSLDLPDPSATDDLGRRLGALLRPGDVIALIGPLGAGKTHLTRAIAAALDAHGVTSPTFVLIQEYQGRLPVYHFDAYRLRGPAEFADLGAHEYFTGDGVCLVEWADRVPDCLPADHLRITMTPTGESTRHALIESTGSRSDHLVRHLQH
jgi:tRNA threonylcarbamoyladenosine biosynthesis protein TsaE